LEDAIKQVGVAFIKLEQHRCEKTKAAVWLPSFVNLFSASPIDVAAEATFAPSNQAFRRKLALSKHKDAEKVLWAWRESVMEGLAVRSGLEALRVCGVLLCYFAYIQTHPAIA
jgi:hypothetical protein